LTPLADLARSAGQASLHGVRAAGIGASGDDAEIGARLRERIGVDVGLFRPPPPASNAWAGRFW